MPAFTLYDKTTGEITGVVEVQTMSALGLYARGNIKSVPGRHDPALCKIDVNTLEVIDRPKTLDEEKADRLYEIKGKREALKRGEVTTNWGVFHMRDLPIINAYVVRALVTPTFVVTWHFSETENVRIGPAALKAIHKKMVEHIMSVEESSWAARKTLDKATTMSAVGKVTF